MAILINGKGLAEKVCARVKTEAEGLPRRPCLAAVLVGNDPASEIYVRNKERDCVKCSIDSRRFDLPESVSERELLELIARLNADDAVTASPCTILPTLTGWNASTSLSGEIAFMTLRSLICCGSGHPQRPYR